VKMAAKGLEVKLNMGAMAEFLMMESKTKK
jgi:hypothetical protein